ncbi:helix-turn-helix transcriptional regulator [Kutzneria buriramensis]|uniref:DNA-binding transcriptional ArsR family regulator n=1 Tax=Kutzneria buriramensis TaxID=1045776 RepID=A0A3E0H2J9_9PSEU|nr:helix-turn-helix domain-containing protein [Kutzneria buriramensis]REH36192.1 DNA-binding transcriptional ArsR family regulator [Kutzneria buriramensis]
MFHPATADLSLPSVMHALSDPVRLAIVAQLAAAGSDPCGDVDVDLHKSTISHHYRVLREAGVTVTTVEGRTRIVRLRREDLDTRFPGLLDAVLRAVQN